MKEVSDGFRKKYKFLQELVFVMITLKLHVFQVTSTACTFSKKSSK